MFILHFDLYNNNYIITIHISCNKTTKLCYAYGYWELGTSLLFSLCNYISDYERLAEILWETVVITGDHEWYFVNETERLQVLRRSSETTIDYHTIRGYAYIILEGLWETVGYAKTETITHH